MGAQLALVPLDAVPEPTRACAVGARVTCAYRTQTEPPWLAYEHHGTVLAVDDPRCWVGSLAFPSAEPAPQAVTAHVQWCYAQGLLSDGRQPVLWDFGKIYWDDQLAAVR